MSQSGTVAACVRRYLSHLTARRAPGLSSRKASLRSFVRVRGRMPAVELRASHLTDWLDARDDWSPGTRATAWGRVRACLRWNVAEGHIPADPLDRMKRPARYARSVRGADYVLPPRLSALLIAKAPPALADLLAALARTGARPGELTNATAENYRPAIKAVVHRGDALPPLYVHKTARRGGVTRDRVIRLDDETAKVARRNARSGGLLFPAWDGGRWTPSRLSRSWDRLCRSPAVQGWLDKRGHQRRRVVPYSFRHTWITDAVGNNVSPQLIADLAGTSVAMIERHYSHVRDDEKAMRRAFVLATR